MAFAMVQPFACTEEEISFFKAMKPRLESLYRYYWRLLEIETARPAGTATMQQEYYASAYAAITRFYQDNKFAVGYYRSGETFLDDKLFVRSVRPVGMFAGNGLHDMGFSSLYDGFVSNLLASELLADYLNAAIAKLDPKPSAESFRQTNGLQWTDSKVALIELLYALYRKGSINNGQADIKHIAAFLEAVFGIELGNYYRTFQEIRIRKTGRTTYLDQLKTVLTMYMDETDLNYKG